MDKLQRTIKFRVWDKLSNKFLFKGFHLTGEVMVFELIAQWLKEHPVEGYGLLGRMNELVFQQFIGILDKNGVEIYEGDMVEVSYKMDDHGDLERQRSEVVFQDGSFGDKWDHFSNYSMLPSFSAEVVGNIFEDVL